ncbi:class I adenylate-forming enzyme family protein [Rhizorhabdus dicambivorans]|uniref:class I adenylate-forming enzyme family protein n=1 Tax=Rhizorhabdus dicambivorans TaxID=1850238 RepID=UPI000A7A2F1F|nr:AMP-binding protein [Rhizorhabdus dicambivorans]
MERDYELDFGRFGLAAPVSRPSIPFGAQTIADVLEQPLRERPDSEALVDRNSRYSYAELDGAVNAACQALMGFGIRAGDRIAASSFNSADLIIAFLASQRLGAIWIGMNRVLAPREKLYLLLDCEASLLLIDDENLSGLVSSLQDADFKPRIVRMNGTLQDDEWRVAVREAAGAPRADVAIDPHAPALISYTSGTTGRPKGAVHSQHNVAVVAAAWVARGDWDVGLRRGCAQAFTINNIMIRAGVLAFAGGGTLICMDRTDPEGVADWVEKESIEVLFAVPTMLHDLLMDPRVSNRRLPSLVRPLTGGASLPDNVRRAFRERFGSEVQLVYGLTEAPTSVAQTDPTEPFVPGSSGRAFPHLEIGILDEEQKMVALGEAGEVAIRASRTGAWAGVYTPLLGYWRRPEATAQALKNGWLLTGDVGRLDEEGRLYILDRRNDMIIRGGANIYPAEVERTMEEHPHVAAAAVVGLPDDRLGQVVAAVVQPARDEPDLAEIDAWLRTQLAGYKVPKYYYVADAMPRNAMNKIVKPTLRDWIGSGELRLALETSRRKPPTTQVPG